MRGIGRVQGWYAGLRLQARLTLQIVVLITALFALLLPVVLMVQNAALRKTAQEKGFSLVGVFAFSSVQGVITGDFLSLRALVRSLVRQPDVRYAMVLDLNGRVLMHSQVDRTGEIFQDPLTRRTLEATEALVQETRSDAGEPLYDFAAPVLLLDERRAVARIGISFESKLRLLRPPPRPSRLPLQSSSRSRPPASRANSGRRRMRVSGMRTKCLDSRKYS